MTAAELAERIYETYCTTRFLHGATEHPSEMVPIGESLLEHMTRGKDIDPTEELRREVDSAFRGEYL